MKTALIAGKITKPPETGITKRSGNRFTVLTVDGIAVTYFNEYAGVAAALSLDTFVMIRAQIKLKDGRPFPDFIGKELHVLNVEARRFVTLEASRR